MTITSLPSGFDPETTYSSYSDGNSGKLIRYKQLYLWIKCNILNNKTYEKILLYTFIAAASALATSCNDYLDCEPITSVSTNVYLYSETDLAAYAAKFYNDSENENDDEYGNILPSHGSATYNLGLFQKIMEQTIKPQTHQVNFS